MGAGESLPQQQLDELIDSTNFKKQELKRWYAKFKKDYPDGQLNIIQFKEMYNTIYNSSNVDQLAEHIFRTFDVNCDGHISFQELMSSLSITTRGSVREKLEWAFNIYDIDGSGSITIDEINSIVRCMQKVTNSREGGKINIDDVAHMFETMDINSDGQLTVDEFIEGVQKHPRFVKMLNGITFIPNVFLLFICTQRQSKLFMRIIWRFLRQRIYDTVIMTTAWRNYNDLIYRAGAKCFSLISKLEKRQIGLCRKFLKMSEMFISVVYRSCCHKVFPSYTVNNEGFVMHMSLRRTCIPIFQ